MKKTIFVLLLILVLVLLPACGDKQQKDPKEPSETDGSSETELNVGNVLLTFAENGQCDYVVICPKDASENMQKICDKLVKNIKNYTGAEVSVKYDSITKKSAREILVGPTNRSESTDTLKSLGYDDYSVTYVDEKIVLAGSHDEAVLAAADWFIDTVLKPQQDAERVVIYEHDTCVQRASYLVGNMILPNGGVETYSLVIPAEASISEYRTAVLLRQLLMKRTGYVLEIRDDSTVGDSEILIGKTVRTQNTVPSQSYRISAVGTRIEIGASTLFAYQELLNDLENQLLVSDINWQSGIDLSVDISDRLLAGSELTLQHTGDIRVMYSNIFGGTDATLYPHAQRNQMLSELFSEYLPDVIGLQEANLAARGGSTGIIALLTEEGIYTELSVGPALNCTPLLYRADVLEVVESGYHAFNDGANDSSKGVTWAVFRIKESGKQVAVASTHFAWNKTGTSADLEAKKIDAAELIQVCKTVEETYGVPIVVGGDYNCNMTSDPYAILINGGMRDIQQLAQRTENYKTYHAYPVFDPLLNIYTKYTAPNKGDYASAIDHAMVYGEALTFHTFDIVTDPYALLSADHCPLIVEFSIN